MIKKNQKIFNIINLLIDILVAFFSYAFAYYIRAKSNLFPYFESIEFQIYLSHLLIILPLLIFFYFFFKLYTPQRFKGLSSEVGKIFISHIFTISIYLLYLYFIKQFNFSRLMTIGFFIINVTFTSAYRIALRLTLRYFRQKGYNIKRAIMIGVSDTGLSFLDKTIQNKQWGYNIVAIFGEKEFRKHIKNPSDIEICKFKDIKEYLETHDIDEIIIALKITEYSFLNYMINLAEKSGIKTLIIPDFMKYLPAKPEIEQIDGITIINTREVPLDNIINNSIKRIFDIVVSILAIILTSPIMLITAILIKLESKGEIIYKQERIGYNQKRFKMYKFRSMRVQEKKDSDTIWTVKNDNRKTKVGNFIRKTNIDELPQFFNVLKGDMSVIGPRPERPYFVKKFREEIPKYMIKHQVRPGITGLAQVNGYRGDTSIKKRIEYDLFYIENWTFGLDIKIFILTIFKGHKNAY